MKKIPSQLCIEDNRNDVLKYERNVKKSGEKRIARIRTSLESILSEEDSTSKNILTTGSDGRMENKSFDGIVSNTEIVFVSNAVCNVRSLVPIIKDRVSFVVDGLEIKTIGSDSMTLYDNNPNLVFPTRTWDALNLWGNPETLSQMKRLISQEIIENPKFCEHFYNRYRVHKKTTQTGDYKFHKASTKQFDFEEGLLYYNPREHIEGVKSGPLRTIQYCLALSLMRKIRNCGEHPDFMDELPTNIVDRLEFLSESKRTNLTKREVEEYKYIYSFFLKIYHQLQYEFFFSEKTEFAISKDTLNDIKTMLSFLNDTISPEKFIR